jgi:hypothetical protein
MEEQLVEGSQVVCYLLLFSLSMFLDTLLSSSGLTFNDSDWRED